MKLLHVVGTRPNFMKVAPIMAAVGRWNAGRPDPDGNLEPLMFQQVLVHTGQHYDERMSQVFFDHLGLPAPDHYLEVGSGTHAEQTARIMVAFEPVLVRERPDLVLVVGDVNSTVAAALVAAKLLIPVAHVEAGLRSRDRTMPEEINRLLTDQLADLLFTTSRDADGNLQTEGVPADRIFFVGNTMIDSLEAHRDRARTSTILAELSLTPGSYGVVTLHRPSNVDDLAQLGRLVRVLGAAGRDLPLIFPVHARTRRRLADAGLLAKLGTGGSVQLVDPLGYLDFLALMADARLVLTDSGGIQEETTVLGIPCLTLRKSTERPVTIWEGTNQLVDPEDEAAISEAIGRLIAEQPSPAPRRPALWDGHASDRITRVIAEWHRSRTADATLARPDSRPSGGVDDHTS